MMHHMLSARSVLDWSAVMTLGELQEDHNRMLNAKKKSGVQIVVWYRNVAFYKTYYSLSRTRA